MGDRTPCQCTFPLRILLTGAIVFTPNVSFAESRIIPDTTLGVEASAVTSLDNLGFPSEIIRGGAVREGNLFHSFQEFNVGQGRETYFLNPSNNIQNILARVTGNTRSEILGTLGVLNNPDISSNPNLFLINPNGIIFGPGAKLNVGGSFVATTANSIRFGEQGFFSATNPDVPPLLTINPSAFLFNQLGSGTIETQSTLLRVSDGQNLTLLGGGINISGGRLDAPGGRIEIGAVSGTGTVGLSGGSTLEFASVSERGDISLSNAAFANVALDARGSIGITARNIILSDSSVLYAGMDSGFGTVQGQAGNITLNATEEVQIVTSSGIFNSVASDATGNSGSVLLTTPSLIVSGGSQIFINMFGWGNSGNIVIEARDRVSLGGTSLNGQIPTTIGNGVGIGGIGQGGDVRITAGSLTMINGAQISNTIAGRGNTGDIIIAVRDRVLIDGISADGRFPSSIRNEVLRTSIGQGGDIRITAGSLAAANGVQISTSTFSQGNAGDVIIQIRDHLSLDGSSVNGQYRSAIDSQVAEVSIGQGGNIQISAESLSVSNGALISASTLGQGDAGNVAIEVQEQIFIDGMNTNDQGSAISTQVAPTASGQGGDVSLLSGLLSITNGASVSSSTFGRGAAGNIFIQTRGQLFLDGSNANGRIRRSIDSQVSQTGIGEGGDIRITAHSLYVTNGASISSSTFGQGDAGDIVVEARDRISLEGTSINGQSSGITTQSLPTAVGQSGRVQIMTDVVSVSGGAGIFASTFGQGDAGDIVVEARDRISIDGVSDRSGQSSGLFTATSGRGRAGTITLNTDFVQISRGAVINAQTFNNFRGGNVQITANTAEITAGGQVITTTTGQGLAGNIIVNVRDSLLLSGTDPDYTTRLRRFPDLVTNQAAASGLFASTSRNSSGQGGTIRVNTPILTLDDRARIEVNSAGNGVAGDLRINATSIEMGNRSQLTAQTRSTNGGNITVRNLDYLLLRQGSRISTNAGTARAGGDGGNINVAADFIVAVPSENSDITANAFAGNGGRVNITSQRLFGIAPREFSTPLSDITASSEQGVQGVVAIDTPDIDPSRGLAELPTDVNDASQQIAQNCPTGGTTASELGEFVVTGRGGLPPNPTELLGSETVLIQLASVDEDATVSDRSFSRGSQSSISSPQSSDAETIIEAQGWLISTDGRVMLVAQNPHPRSNMTTTCGNDLVNQR
jgi:filamentous hemagglutinin family protein